MRGWPRRWGFGGRVRKYPHSPPGADAGGCFARGALPEPEWYERHWAVHGVSAEAARRALRPLATRLGCDLTQLLPNDSLSGSLSLRAISFCGLDPDSAIEEYCERDLPALIPGGEARIDELRLTRDSALIAFVGVVEQAVL